MKKRKAISFILIATCAALAISLGIIGPQSLEAQSNPPKFEVDPYWPKPLPDKWVTGEIGSVCVDAQDHVFIFNRSNLLTDNELEAGHPAPPVIEFDSAGNVVNSWGDVNSLPDGLHGCGFDHEGNLWITGDKGMVQKYTHDGSKLLLQIGTKGVYDTSDGTITGRALNSSHTEFFQPAGIAVDPSSGDVYVADGYGNSRVVVFDHNGQFLRQWGRQGTKAEAEAGVGGAFMQVVHCLTIGNDGLVYVCDRQGDRVQVFDKMGNFQRNIWVRTGSPHLPDGAGTVLWVAFSPDPAQKYMYVANEHNAVIDIIDHVSGQIVGTFGRVGHQLGEFTHPHSVAVDSKGNVYVAEPNMGKRVQNFKIVTGH